MTDPFVLKAHRIAVPHGLKIEPCHPQREWMNEHPFAGTTKKGLANRCLPMLMANQMGWEIVTTHSYVVTSMPDGTFIFYFNDPKGPPRMNQPVNNFTGDVVTWTVPWVFETPPGWDLMIIPPMNKPLPDGVTPLSALVETDHAHATFTLNWRVTRLKSLHIEAGQTIATILPYPTDALEEFSLAEDDVVPDGYQEWAARRHEITRHPPPDHDPTTWEKGYWMQAKRRKIKKNALTLMPEAPSDPHTHGPGCTHGAGGHDELPRH